jgi:hypothetical protein
MLIELMIGYGHYELVGVSNFHPLVHPSFHIHDALTVHVQSVPPTRHEVSKMNYNAFDRHDENNPDQDQYKFQRQSGVVAVVPSVHIFLSDDGAVLKIVVFQQRQQPYQSKHSYRRLCCRHDCHHCHRPTLFGIGIDGSGAMVAART